ncbi:uncharacterized protein LOC103310227 [Acyrthosiphon pisum]|uniref:Uncharacterized protein n=1 Tax=Acyrthosiphon pisum TaxID=7029 RepID=A0A8R2B823_ACYPI|nr:uncharacterized protein LOC103310227 [Acyrthosiphon pisum]|eukprot:XP_008186006.1 PREDICTED: uncharacterized protein LOC103310227 [Acyrthosiphon pisum]
MRDYLDTTHMTKLNQTLTNEQNTYYIPHHVVIRPDRTTTKMRIVFDASAKTSSGMSLNDNLYCGKKLQQDLHGIILRFRLHPIVFTADIKNMFRQIVVTETHRPYQRLLYRFNPEEPVQEYEMNRVTFGQKCSPFISIRTLHKLIDDEASNDETLKAIVHQDLYVDDIVTGTSTLSEALELTQNLITLFEKGKFELRNWSSNSEQLLTRIPMEHRQVLPITFEERDSCCMKVLGLMWDLKVDSLSYLYQPCPVKFSKRVILSEIARIYDPLGLLTPVTTDLKRLMKYLWLVGVNWDETIPEEAMTSWTQYHRELPLLATLKIPRMVTHPNATYELLGFSDASEAAYAAAVYLRIDTGTEVKCHLLMGKSKIAPARKISVPRLELCSAWLLARLLAFAQDNLSAIDIENVAALSDSTLTLQWIRNSCGKLLHLPTNDNPTDCASRGLRPDILASHDIWWQGPLFLKQPEREWPVESTVSPISCSEEENEEKRITLLSREKEEHCRLLYQSDNLPKVLRFTVYWLRLRDRLGKKPSLPITSPPTTDETERALRSLVRWTQNIYFSDEKKEHSMGKQAPKHLRKLTPFLDDDHLLMVRGRLGYAEIPYNEKHPLLMPKSSRLTELLIDFTHRKNGHPGPQTVQYLLRQNYWIFSSRSVVKQRIHRCIPCFRAKPRLAQPIMGNLPSFRISQIKPFSRTGVNFAGPFQVIAAMIRKIKVTKAYIYIFVRMVTTAVHIELVSDLSTQLFIAALDRFIGRRGRCSDIYSDCGTNFVGTNRYLQEVYSILKGPRCVENAVDNQIR